MNLIDNLNWRHACKRMNGSKVSPEIINNILEAINLVPTSLGLQAYKVFVIENKELKDQIFKEACPQQPIIECSHLLVFATYTQITEKYLDEYFALIERKRNPGREWCDNYRTRINYFVENNTENMENWLARQTYIALGVACVAAADEKIDSVPIEGFNKEEMNRILNLPEQHLSSVVLLPLGHKDPELDWLNNKPKVRKDLFDLIELIK